MTHERVMLVTAETALTPSVPAESRVHHEILGDGLERVVLRFGFMETPDVPSALAKLEMPPDPTQTSYFLSRQTIVPSATPGMAPWREKLFAALARAAQSPMAGFCLPPNRVVELGSQVEI